MGEGGQSSHQQSVRDYVCHAGEGAAAGAIAATFVCPLDVIKTRLQVHGLPEVPQSGARGVVETVPFGFMFRFVDFDSTI